MFNWLSKLLGTKEESTQSENGIETTSSQNGETAIPFAGLNGVKFGHYSDNNKSYKKTLNWYRAEDHYKEKNYAEAFAALFDYLTDEEEGNVYFRADGQKFTFVMIQGSKKVHGTCDGEHIRAEVPLAVMDQPSNAVMRRLLELNYTLYYSHTALDDKNTLYMVFETSVSSADPNKLYYGLRELAIKADKQDDLLIADFSSLKPADIDHIEILSEKELDIKYEYFRKWIQETLARVQELNQDSFSGAIAYLLLSLIYRIDFLVVPMAKLMSEIERISNLYWAKKEERPLVERNQMMKDAIRKLLDITRADFADSVYRSKSTFAIASPPKTDKIKEHIVNANRDSHWYVDNKYPDIALAINEYGMVYNQFIYSMPGVMTELVTIYSAVMHREYFAALGMTSLFYDEKSGTFDKELITAAVDNAINKYKEKYVALKWDHARTSYKSLYDFGTTFSEQMANINLETRR